MPSRRTRLLRGAQDTYRSVESLRITVREIRDIARRAQRFAIDFGAADRIRFDVWSALLACGGDVTRLHEHGGHDIGGEG